MPAFRDGTHVNQDYARGPYCRLRISAGPLRGVYVDQLVLEADGNSLNCRPENLLEVTGPQNTKLMWQRRKAAKKK